MGKNFDSDEIRRLRRMQRKKEMQRKKRQQAIFRRMYKAGTVVLILAIIITVVLVKRKKNDTPEKADAQQTEQIPEEGSESQNNPTEIRLNPEPAVSENNTLSENNPAQEERPVYSYAATENTLQLSDELISTHAIFVDTDNGTILADKGAKDRISPASMTKVLTLLVAVENIQNPDNKFTITPEITDYCYVNGCSVAGFEKGESVTIKDLLYGTILPSGADAALGLAYYTAGSQEAFVEMMNQKLYELGLSESAHFTNCIGIYDDNHYCSVYDIAVIMNAAIDNETCREVLSAHTYPTSITEQHPEGILLSNWFLRRIEDKDTGGEVLCGKTGYVVQSGSCAVSYGADTKGRHYICTTVNANSKWRCINDHAYLYHYFSGTGE